MKQALMAICIPNGKGRSDFREERGLMTCNIGAQGATW